MRRRAGREVGDAVEGDEKGGKNVSRRIIKSDKRGNEERGGGGKRRWENGRLRRSTDKRTTTRTRWWCPSLVPDCRSLGVPAGTLLKRKRNFPEEW